jgi:hypothetical protein
LHSVGSSGSYPHGHKLKSGASSSCSAIHELPVQNPAPQATFTETECSSGRQRHGLRRAARAGHGACGQAPVRELECLRCVGFYTEYRNLFCDVPQLVLAEFRFAHGLRLRHPGTARRCSARALLASPSCAAAGLIDFEGQCEGLLTAQPRRLATPGEGSKSTPQRPCAKIRTVCKIFARLRQCRRRVESGHSRFARPGIPKRSLTG